MTDKANSAWSATFDAEDVRLLVDIGFMIQSRGFVGQAARIFDGVLVMRPDQEAGAIGRALCDLHIGDFSSAIERLRKAPPTDSARLFLGMAYARAGDHAQAARVLAGLEKVAENPSVAELAGGLLSSLAPSSAARGRPSAKKIS